MASMNSILLDQRYSRWMLGEEAVSRRKQTAVNIASRLERKEFGAGDLRELIDILDHERLCRSYDDPSLVALNLHWVEHLLLDISAQLIRTITPASYIERELQACALSSALGLLHADGVQNFSNDFHRDVDERIRGRFQDVQQQAAQLRSAAAFSGEKLRTFQTAYYLCSGAAFAQRFRQGTPVAVDAIKQAIASVSLAFAIGSVVGGFGSINLPEVVGNLKAMLNPFRPGMSNRYESLFSIQELSRMIIASSRIAQEFPQSKVGDSEKISSLSEPVELQPLECSRELARAVLDKIIAILNSSPYDNFETWVRAPTNFQLDLRAALNQGPPAMDHYWFIYGLLDCAVQCCRILPSSELSEDTMSRVGLIIRHCPEPSHRCKAIEILLSNPEERSQNFLWLAQPRSPWPDDVKNEIDTVNQCLGEDSGLLRSRGSIVSTMTAASLPTSLPSTEAPGSATPISLHEWTEQPFPNPPPLDRSGSFKLRPSSGDGLNLKNVKLATISPNGRAALFLSTNGLKVFALNFAAWPGNGNLRFLYQAPRGQELRSAAVSDRYAAFISNRSLIVHNYRIGQLAGELAFSMSSSNGLRHPDCVAIHESPQSTKVAVAGWQGDKASIVIYKLERNCHLAAFWLLEASFQSSYELSNFSKAIAFAPTGNRLSAITCGNRTFVWQLSDGGTQTPSCYSIEPRRYPTVRHFPFPRALPSQICPLTRCYQESSALGLTSASLFYTPSQSPWALLTTAPSTEAFTNHGEFSYLSPIGAPPDDAGALSQMAYNITTLPTYRRSILAGAVSDPPYYAALLERSGRIFLLRLDRAGSGQGVTTVDSPVELSQQLSEQRSPLGVSPGSIRFCKADDGRLMLVAVDIYGKVVRQTFHADAHPAGPG